MQPYRSTRRGAVTYVTRSPEVLRSRLQQGLEAVKILYCDLPRVNIQKSLCLQAHRDEGNQFAYRSKLIGEFPTGCRQLKLDSERSRFALALGKFEQCLYESLAGCRERQLLDNTHLSPQPRSYDPRHLERDFWMLHAVRLTILREMNAISASSIAAAMREMAHHRGPAIPRQTRPEHSQQAPAHVRSQTS